MFAKDAKLVCGGKADNMLMPATILDHVTPEMRIYSEETFGPVKCVVRVSGVAEFTDLRWITLQTGERHYSF